jgi:hypothetical protein
MRFVKVKTAKQQDIQAVRGLRSGLVELRMAKGTPICAPV